MIFKYKLLEFVPFLTKYNIFFNLFSLSSTYPGTSESTSIFLPTSLHPTNTFLKIPPFWVLVTALSGSSLSFQQFTFSLPSHFISHSLTPHPSSFKGSLKLNPTFLYIQSHLSLLKKSFPIMDSTNTFID